jgi:biotin operon repressor
VGRVQLQRRQRHGHGDLVLTEDEVTPVIAKLQQQGIEVTAVHNHLQHETPGIMYVHIEGRGAATKLAKSLHDVLALTGTLRETPAGVSTQKIDLDTAAIDQAMGRQGKGNGGIYQFAVPRSETIRDQGMTIPPVLLPGEVNPAISVLRENGIQVTALHSHLLNDEPHLLFTHFWANDEAVKLARGVRAALDKTNSKP